MSATVLHDFFDGRGPVEAKIYDNPDGSPGGIVDQGATVGKGAWVGEGATVGKGAWVGEGAMVGKGATVGEGAWVGEGATVDKGAWVGKGAMVGKGATDFAAIAEAYRAERPDIPVIPDLDAKILAAIQADGASLNMLGWHSCETTHCRAGWAVHLAGKAGYDLEKRVGPAAAGGAIYRASTGRWPNFYASDEAALADIKACAAGAAQGDGK